MIKKIIYEHIDVVKSLQGQEKHISKICKLILNSINNNNKILLCGNGGSASDSTHIAAEFVVRFEKKRKSLPAIALTSNLSNITAAGNDLGFKEIFSRQIEALGNKGDILLAMSTSGNSKNILNAIKSAKSRKMYIIGLTGMDGGLMKNSNCDELLMVQSQSTARIQEVHILVGHIICKYIEKYHQ